jgi:histidinol-phosphatase (PHP family)
VSPLPPDNHVHTEWSWDAVAGSMKRSCAEAVRLGLPSIAFTEHVDATRWVLAPEVRT